MGWKDKIKSAQASSSRNNLRGGHYPLLYVNRLYMKRTREQGDAFFAEVTVLESSPLSQVEWATTEGGEKFQRVVANKPGEKVDIPFFVDRFDAALSNFKSFLSVVESVDMFDLAEEDADAFEAILEKAEDPDGENPYHGTVISVDAPMGYTQKNKKLISYYNFSAAPDEAQEHADTLLERAKAA